MKKEIRVQWRVGWKRRRNRRMVERYGTFGTCHRGEYYKRGEEGQGGRKGETVPYAITISAITSRSASHRGVYDNIVEEVMQCEDHFYNGKGLSEQRTAIYICRTRLNHAFRLIQILVVSAMT